MTFHLPKVRELWENKNTPVQNEKPFQGLNEYNGTHQKHPTWQTRIKISSIRKKKFLCNQKSTLCQVCYLCGINFKLTHDIMKDPMT